MLRYLVVGLAAMAVGIEAQSSSATQKDEPTPTSESEGPATHTIQAGYPGFQFTPNTTFAEVGDIIEFEFYPPDHSVIRANFRHGCIPYERVGVGKVGFHTDQYFLNGIPDNPPTFQVRVNDTEPIFFYCGADNSCKGKHMIGVINPNDTWTLDEHLKRVEEAEFELTPDEDWPSEAAKPTDYNENYASTQSSLPTSTGDASQSNDNDSQGSHGHLSPGAIAGIAIGSAGVLILAGALIYLCGRRGGFDKAYRKSTPVYPPTMGSVHGGMTPMMNEQKTLTPKMNEGWGNGPAPANPAMGYAAVPNNDGQGSPPLNGTYGPRSPPMSPNAHSGYGGYTGTMVSAMTGNENGTYHDPSMGPHLTPSPPVPGQQARSSGGPPPPAPVELPTSSDPGNSPLPAYPARQFSWAQGSETNYRPGKV